MNKGLNVYSTLQWDGTPSKARRARTLQTSNRMLCTWQRLWRGQFGVAARGVDAADLDEAGH